MFIPMSSNTLLNSFIVTHRPTHTPLTNLHNLYTHHIHTHKHTLFLSDLWSDKLLHTFSWLLISLWQLTTSGCIACIFSFDCQTKHVFRRYTTWPLPSTNWGLFCRCWWPIRGEAIKVTPVNFISKPPIDLRAQVSNSAPISTPRRS